MKRQTIIFAFLQIFELCCLAQSETGGGSDASVVLQQFEGCWHPNKPGWHSDINITTDGSKLYLTMTTDEGDKWFDEVKVNESK